MPVPLELMPVLGSFPEFSQDPGAKPEGTPQTGVLIPSRQVSGGEITYLDSEPIQGGFTVNVLFYSSNF